MLQITRKKLRWWLWFLSGPTMIDEFGNLRPPGVWKQMTDAHEGQEPNFRYRKDVGWFEVSNEREKPGP
jgi:hypothetical protein